MIWILVGNKLKAKKKIGTYNRKQHALNCKVKVETKKRYVLILVTPSSKSLQSDDGVTRSKTYLFLVSTSTLQFKACCFLL